MFSGRVGAIEIPGFEAPFYRQGRDESSKGEVIMEIKVLGPGCPKCRETEKKVKEAVSEVGADVAVVKVADVMEIAKHGVLVTPAVVVDGEVKCVGKIPDKEEIKSWIDQ
jgi:small redox-active disulfide protein 2